MRVGGPYTVTVSQLGYRTATEEEVYLSLGQNLRLDFRLERQAIELAVLEISAERDEVLNAGRTGAATFVGPARVAALPSIKRSTRDLTRLDPRGDGN
ncbi:MAG: carboxypeptidase-like regulatory domain-containing protein [Gemmatimonadetes bacterium]|nr:carboxypeptidase-like regulatory domain-containing protein [Gemmatimonadota bacterium]